MLGHFIGHFLFRAMKPFFDPVFLADEMPDLDLFYPDEAWYREQRMVQSFSSSKRNVELRNHFSLKDIFTMLFWECKPAKLIAGSLLVMILLLFLKPLLPEELFYSLYLLGFVIFIIACCYNADNFLNVANYLFKSVHNKFRIRSMFAKHLEYGSFIADYNRFRFRRNINSESKLVNLFIGLLWIGLLLLFLVLLIIV